MTLLRIDNLHKHFGGLVAVEGVSLDVAEREIRALIGPNGAGKTTLFNVITGFYRPTQGAVIYNGEPISGKRTSTIASRGLVRTFQGSTLFEEFTVLEHVLVGCHLHARQNPLRAVFWRDPEHERRVGEQALEALEMMGLADRRDERATNLPHGLQRSLNIAVTLAARPRMLLLDEPFAGMNPAETDVLMGLLRKIRDSGVTILLVEHDMKAVMGLSDRVTVLNFGRLLAEGSPEEVRRNEQVIEAYLGTS